MTGPSAASVPGTSMPTDRSSGVSCVMVSDSRAAARVSERSVDVRLGDRQRPGGRREHDEVQTVDLELGFHRIGRGGVGRAHLVLVDEVLAVGIRVEREVDPVGGRPIDDVLRGERVGLSSLATFSIDRRFITYWLSCADENSPLPASKSIFSDTTTFE